MSWVRNVRDQPWLAFIIASVAMIAFGPRIPIDVLVPGRTFDLRIMDLALVVALPFWLRRHALGALQAPLARPIALYLLVALTATFLAVETMHLNALRGALYLGKEVEYYLLFLIVVTTIRTRSQVNSVGVAFQVTAFVTALWFAYQLIVQQDQSLLSLEQLLPPDAFVSPSRSESYGPHLLGESSPFSTGGFFMLAFLASVSLTVTRRGTRSWVHAMGSVGLLACLAVSQSRVALAGALLSAIPLAAVLRVSRKRAAAVLMAVILAGIGISAAIAYRHLPEELAPTETSTPGAVGVARRLVPSAIEYGVAHRIDIWRPIVQTGLQRPLIGFGKGSLGAVDGLDAGEAHMYYLRVFAETGILGLAAFLAILVSIVRMCYRGIRLGGAAQVDILAWSLAATAAMAMCSLLQDAFVPVILAELFWITAGIALATFRASVEPRDAQVTSPLT